jgi:hypothetical protein
VISFSLFLSFESYFQSLLSDFFSLLEDVQDLSKREFHTLILFYIFSTLFLVFIHVLCFTIAYLPYFVFNGAIKT